MLGCSVSPAGNAIPFHRSGVEMNAANEHTGHFGRPGFSRYSETQRLRGEEKRIKMSREPSKVSRSRFEFEENGEVAYLEFDLDGSGWMTLWHTEVPPALRGKGVADMLARTALEYARDNKLKLDVICPVALNFINKNPEFKDLVGK